jgi:hypothetical protein
VTEWYFSAGWTVDEFMDETISRNNKYSLVEGWVYGRDVVSAVPFTSCLNDL